MRDVSTDEKDCSEGSLPAGTFPEYSGDLKKRLKSFWNLQQEYWEMLSSAESVESPFRQNASTFFDDGASVLDVACGTGANANWISGRCKYFGIDISIKALRQQVNPSVQRVCGDGDSLPFREGFFDAAIATYVIEHAVDPVEMLGEMFRVVRPGGRVVLMGPAWDLPFWYPNSLLSKSKDPWWRLAYSIRRLRGQLAGWWFGTFPFEKVADPDAFHREFIHDADAVYIVWTYEIIQLARKWGHRLVHWEVDDQLLGSNFAVRVMKKLLMRMPIYSRSGSTVLLVFEK